MANDLTNEIAAKVAILPLEGQREVLRMVESLVENTLGGSPHKSQRRRLLGSLEHLNINLTNEDIQDARLEMWGEYMRVDSK